AAGRAFPFVFGGDGAGFACAPDRAAEAGAALAAVRCWAAQEFGMELRVAMVPVAEVRAAGLDVAVARYQPSPGVDYAMFSGGGLSWAETRMKAGAYALPKAPAGTIPDLTGLSCRWSNVKSRNGSILSVVIQPVGAASGPEFTRLSEKVISIARHLERAGHPVPTEGAITRWPPPGLTLEAHASHGAIPLARHKRKLLMVTLLNWFFLRWKIPVNGFDPAHYTVTVGRNADFRKFDDGLKMTLDCDAGTQKKLRAVLEQAAQDGTIRYGLCEQDEAMMTCIVPSILTDDHVHFIDGAAGGYTQAAAGIKVP
ncbi:MAG: adenylate cyclase, partial [Rhodobacteraceae bacterium]